MCTAAFVALMVLQPQSPCAAFGDTTTRTTDRTASFDDWFTGKSIRFDYFHSGFDREERISLDEFRLEGDWPGHRTRLVDELGLGEYEFDVAEPNGGVLFSRGFDSIFGEWRTTSEASAGTWRTLHESQRFPEPRRSVRVRLKRRDENGRLRTIYDAPFDPTSRAVNRAPLAPRGQLWPLFKNGDPAEKLDLLVLAEGYTAAEREKFHADAERLTAILFATEPFKGRKHDFNVWGLELAADESGITDPRRGHWRNSPLGFRSNAFGIDRYALSYENRAIREAAALAPYDALVVIWNGPKHAGGGIYNLWAVAPADSPTAAYVFVHEIGHSLAGLADEYYSADVAYQQGDVITEPNRPNATALGDPAKLKWRDFVDAATPLPTPWDQARYDKIAAAHQSRVRALEARSASPAELTDVYAELRKTAGAALENEPHAGKTGAFEGANYRGKGLYRPEVDCIMFSHVRGAFCRVCVRAIERAIDHYVE
jgi:hypothetical protein